MAPEQLHFTFEIDGKLQSCSGAAPEPSGERWITDGGSYEPLRSSSGQLHTFHLLCSTLLHLAQELLRSRSRAAHPTLPSKLTPLALLLRSGSGAAPLTINFACKIKLLRSQKQSILFFFSRQKTGFACPSILT